MFEEESARGTTEVSPKARTNSLIQQKSSCQTHGLQLPESPGVGIHGSSRDGCRKALTHHLLLTTAVAKMAAIPACWGSSWISEGRATGAADSPPSIFPVWLGIPIGSAMTNAFSASPSERGLVVLHQMESSGNGGGEKNNTVMGATSFQKQHRPASVLVCFSEMANILPRVVMSFHWDLKSPKQP